MWGHPPTLWLKGAHSMSTYGRSKINYRKIYEQHYGPIPRDEDGRSYDIHHIDGDHNNNHPSNLKAVSLREHYEIHYAQGDYGACYFMKIRSDVTPEIISRLASLANVIRIQNGSHNFLGDKNPNGKRVKDGTHNFLGDKNPIHGRIVSGAAQQMSSESMRRLVAIGKHNWLKQNGGSDVARDRAKKRIEDGTHHFLDKEKASQRLKARVRNGTHPNKIKDTCPHCGKTGGHANMKRFHFDNCKLVDPTANQSTCIHCNKTGSSSLMKRYHFDNCRYRCD
jgi:hypothetical protein